MGYVKGESFYFNQANDLLVKLKKSIFEIGYYSISQGDKKAAKQFHNGICYALSAKFLMEERNYGVGGGKRYFNWLQQAIESYKKNAAISNRDPIDIKRKLLMQYHRQFLYTELELLQKIQYSQNIRNNYIKLRVDFENTINFLLSKNTVVTNVDVLKFYCEIKEGAVYGKIKCKKLVDIINKYVADNSEEFEKIINSTKRNGKENSYKIESLADNILMGFYKKLDGRGEGANENFMITSKDFALLLGEAILAEKKRYHDNYGAFLLKRGLYQFSIVDEDYKQQVMTNSLTEREAKYNVLMSNLADIDKSVYVSLLSPTHAMAISVIKDRSSTYWTFFDPNNGAKVYDNHTEFKHHVDKLLTKEGYFNQSVKDTLVANFDFSVDHIKFEENPNHKNDDSVWKVARDGEEAYVLKSMKENQIIFDIDNSRTTARIIDFTLDDNSNKVKNIVVEINSDTIGFNVHIETYSIDSVFRELKKDIYKILNYQAEHGVIKDLSLSYRGYISPFKGAPLSLLKGTPSEKYKDISCYNPELESLNARVKNAIQTLDLLSQGRVSPVEISSDPKAALTTFFDSGSDELTNRKILKNITDSKYYLKSRQELLTLQYVSTNNPEFATIKPYQALEFSKEWYVNKVENKLWLMNNSIKYNINNASYSRQNLTLALDVNLSIKRQVNLGVLYLYYANKGKKNKFKDKITKYNELNYVSASGFASKDELEQLDKFRQNFYALDEIKYIDIHKKVLTEKIEKGIKLDGPGGYQLMVNNKVFNLFCHESRSEYIYSVYNTEGWEYSFSANNQEDANKKLSLILTNYLSDLNDGHELLQIEYQLCHLEFPVSPDFSAQVPLENLYQQNIVSERDKLVKLGITYLNGDTISYSTLYDMGMAIDGEIITTAAISANANWRNHLHFDPLKLNDFYTITDPTNPELQLSLKVVRKLFINDDSASSLLLPHHDPIVVNEAQKRLDTIKHFVNTDGKINPYLWRGFATVTATSSRLQSIGAYTGKATQLFSIARLSVSSVSMSKRLQDPNISDEERQEIIKQLALGWSSTVVDFGTDVMQPTFNKLHYYFNKKLSSGSRYGAARLGYQAGAKSAKYAGSALNMASAAFDIYDAIDNLSKAIKETNPELRNDYFINSSFSAIGAAVSIATAVALAIGISTAGPIGILTGAAIMLGGMTYNAIRQVEYIKREIDLSGWEIFKTGIRLAFGAEPEQYIVQRLKDKDKEKLEKHIKDLLENAFEQRIKPMGYNNYLYVNEEIDLSPVKKYVFVYKIDHAENYSEYDINNIIREKNITGYMHDDNYEFSDVFSGKRNNKVPYVYRYALMRDARSPLSENELNHWEKTVNIDDFHIIEKEVIDLHNRNAQNNAIIKDMDMFNIHPALNSMRSYWHDRNKDTETSVLSIKGDNVEDFSTHFNLGWGDDLAIGYKDYKNSFDVGQGAKIFIGGDKEDVFYLMDNVEASVNSPASVLDGQDGSDTLIVMGLRCGNEGYELNLARGYVKYINNELRLATLLSIENAYGQKNKKDLLIGDDNVNVLNGGGGYTEDRLEGGGGNDILTLLRGTAIGGEGIDTYIISSAPYSAAHVVIYEDALDEVSTIQLQAKSDQIESIELKNNDIVIKFIDDYNYNSTVVLKGAFKLNSYGEKKELTHSYILNTSDNMILVPNWPAVLDKDIINLDSSLEMLAFYNPLIEKNLNEDVQSVERTRVTITKDLYRSDLIKINDNEINLPPFIKASINGHKATIDTIFGNGLGSTFENLGGGDFITANGGDNIYHIPNLLLTVGNENNTLRLECRILAGGPHSNNTMHLVLDDVSGYDLNVDKNLLGDIVIRHKDNPDAFVSIEISNAHKLTLVDGKQLITLIDKNEKLFYIDSSAEIFELLEMQPTLCVTTEGNDHIVIPDSYRLADNRLYAKHGDDVISDLSGRGHKIYGDVGNDIIYAKGGDNMLSGGDGHDELFGGNGNDLLYGGQGDDILNSGDGINVFAGGEGDDSYVFEPGHGGNFIFDNKGRNSIIFKGIDYRVLQFKKQDSNLTINININNSNKTVTIENYFVVGSEQRGRLFTFKTDEYQLAGDNLSLLIDSMSSTSDLRWEPVQPLVNSSNNWYADPMRSSIVKLESTLG
ncbi:TPA: RTX toxin [Yersinia enterocolitica]|nr:RTX toxin [Yersinia enterocolitica]